MSAIHQKIEYTVRKENIGFVHLKLGRTDIDAEESCDWPQ